MNKQKILRYVLLFGYFITLVLLLAQGMRVIRIFEDFRQMIIGATNLPYWIIYIVSIIITFSSCYLGVLIIKKVKRKLAETPKLILKEFYLYIHTIIFIIIIFLIFDVIYDINGIINLG